MAEIHFGNIIGVFGNGAGVSSCTASVCINASGIVGTNVFFPNFNLALRPLPARIAYALWLQGSCELARGISRARKIEAGVGQFAKLTYKTGRAATSTGKSSRGINRCAAVFTFNTQTIILRFAKLAGKFGRANAEAFGSIIGSYFFCAIVLAGN